MSDAERLVQRVFAEAAAECGDDPKAIARRVAERVKEMSPENQKLFASVAEIAASDYVPDAGAGTRKPH